MANWGSPSSKCAPVDVNSAIASVGERIVVLVDAAPAVGAGARPPPWEELEAAASEWEEAAASNEPVAAASPSDGGALGRDDEGAADCHSARAFVVKTRDNTLLRRATSVVVGSSVVSAAESAEAAVVVVAAVVIIVVVEAVFPFVLSGFRTGSSELFATGAAAAADTDDAAADFTTPRSKSRRPSGWPATGALLFLTAAEEAMPLLLQIPPPTLTPL